MAKYLAVRGKSNQIYKFSGTDWKTLEDSSIKYRLNVRTGTKSDDIVKYDLTTNTSASEYCKIKFNVGPSNKPAYIAKNKTVVGTISITSTSNYSVQSEGTFMTTSKVTTQTVYQGKQSDYISYNQTYQRGSAVTNADGYGANADYNVAAGFYVEAINRCHASLNSNTGAAQGAVNAGNLYLNGRKFINGTSATTSANASYCAASSQRYTASVRYADEVLYNSNYNYVAGEYWFKWAVRCSASYIEQRRTTYRYTYVTNTVYNTKPSAEYQTSSTFSVSSSSTYIGKTETVSSTVKA